MSTQYPTASAVARIVRLAQMDKRINEINELMEKDLENSGADFGLLAEKNSVFIAAQPAELQVGYAANANLSELANEWFLRNGMEAVKGVFSKFGVSQALADEFVELLYEYIKLSK